MSILSLFFLGTPSRGKRRDGNAASFSMECGRLSAFLMLALLFRRRQFLEEMDHGHTHELIELGIGGLIGLVIVLRGGVHTGDMHDVLQGFAHGLSMHTSVIGAHCSAEAHQKALTPV